MRTIKIARMMAKDVCLLVLMIDTGGQVRHGAVVRCGYGPARSALFLAVPPALVLWPIILSLYHHTHKIQRCLFSKLGLTYYISTARKHA